MRGLCPRLLAVYESVPVGTAAADVGCDRGLLALHLAQARCRRVIAVDANPQAVLSVWRQATRWGLTDKIEVRRGDGLALCRDEVDVVSVCGLGGDAIVGILAPWRDTVPGARFLVQPMTRAAILRRWAAAEGLHISNERLARHGKRIYQIIELVAGGHPYRLTPLECEVGPITLGGDPLRAEFARQELDRLLRVPVLTADAQELRARLECIAQTIETGGR